MCEINNSPDLKITNLLISCLIAPKHTIPRALITLYGGAKKVTNLRTRYAELKEQRLDKRTILLVITLEYAKDTAIGYVVGGAAGKAGNKYDLTRQQTKPIATVAAEAIK